ncbi:MAG: hypothetical protein AB7I30_07750, partial [Isosphaeraceae bacterium]
MATQTGTPIGIEFTETMRGFFSTKVKDDYQRGFDRGQQEGTPLEFTVTVTADDYQRLVDAPEHEARINGAVTAPALSDTPLRVRDGRFQLLVKDPETTSTRRMTYAMPLTADDGRSFFLEGFKTIHDAQGPTVWSDTTTLFITVSEGDAPGGPVVGKGIVHIHLADFKKQLGTMKVLNAPNRIESLRALARFGGFF